MKPLLASSQGRCGTALLVALALLALLAPWLTPYQPLDMVDQPLLPIMLLSPTPLGTDQLGRDVLTGLLYGARLSLLITVMTVISATGFGMVLGALAGFMGGFVDMAVSRLADAMQTIPAFLWVLAVVSLAGPMLPVLIIGLTLSAWTLPARITRAEVMRLKEADFVKASQLLGRSKGAVALRVVLPNVMGGALSLTTIIAGNALLMEAALSFLGLSDPNSLSWGSMIAEGRAVLRSAPHLVALPGACLFITVLAVALVGNAIGEGQGKSEF